MILAKSDSDRKVIFLRKMILIPEKMILILTELIQIESESFLAPPLCRMNEMITTSEMNGWMNAWRPWGSSSMIKGRFRNGAGPLRTALATLRARRLTAGAARRPPRGAEGRDAHGGDHCRGERGTARHRRGSLVRPRHVITRRGRTPGRCRGTFFSETHSFACRHRAAL